MFKYRAILTIVACFIPLSLVANPKSEGKNEAGIEVWQRASGSFHDGANPAPKNLVTVFYKDLKIQKAKMFDPQYEKTHEYEGFYLDELLARYKHSEGNMVLLHFENKMIVPMRLENAMEKKKLFIATKIKIDKKWTSDFPILAKVDMVKYYRDPNPTKFSHNKTVAPLTIKDLYYRSEKSGERVKKFNPWQHVSTLVGIEFVDEAAYYGQFEISSAEDIKKGLLVFKERCQYCHGVHKVGAGFGWDFASPLNLTEKRNKLNMHLFVKYPKVDGFNRGLKMPNQIDISTEETKLLWGWMEAVSKAKLKNY